MPKGSSLFSSFFVAITFGLPVISFAGGPGSVGGKSERFLVQINEDFPFNKAVLEVWEMKAGEDDYNTQRWTGPFLKECVATEAEIVCRANRRTILAGVTYKKTVDATPLCKGVNSEPRYTCVKGCNKGAPRYLSISPYEC